MNLPTSVFYAWKGKDWNVSVRIILATKAKFMSLWIASSFWSRTFSFRFRTIRSRRCCRPSLAIVWISHSHLLAAAAHCTGWFYSSALGLRAAVWKQFSTVNQGSTFAGGAWQELAAGEPSGSSLGMLLPRVQPYHTWPVHTIPYHTIPYLTIPYHTIPYHT